MFHRPNWFRRRVRFAAPLVAAGTLALSGLVLLPGVAAAATPVAATPQPVAGTTVLTAAACVSANSCVAVGNSPAGGIIVPITVTASGTTPGNAQVVAGTAGFDSVTCPTVNTCVAVGQSLPSGGPFTNVGAAVPIAMNTSPPAVGRVSFTGDWGHLFGISCVSATRCLAVGSIVSINFSSPQVVPVTVVGSQQVSLGEPQFPAAPTYQLRGVACPSATLCEAVGSAGGREAAVFPITVSPSGITVQDRLPLAGMYLEAVACQTAVACQAVGYEFVGATASQGEVVPITVSGSVTSVGSALSVPSTPYLHGVTCPSDTTCLAVGDQSYLGNATGMLLPITGSGADTAAGSGETITGTFLLSGATCPSVSLCEAVGATTYTDTTGTHAEGVVVPIATGLAGTTSSLGADRNSTVYGQSVTFTATVTSSNDACTAGQFTLLDGSTPIQTQPTSGGRATFLIFNLPAGSHSISASFAPSDTADCLRSTSPSLHQVVLQAVTTTTVTSSANPSTAGQSVRFDVTVAPVSPGVGTPLGTLTIKDGTTTLATSTLFDGRTSLTTSTLSVGTHEITAVYSGGDNFAGSTSADALEQVVTSATTGTTTHLESSQNPSAHGQPVTFTATVISSDACLQGTMTFLDGQTELGTAATSVAGQASYTTSSLAVGTHDVTASFIPADATACSGSTSSPVGQVVTASTGATDTTLTASTTDSPFARPVTFTAHVAATSGSDLDPSPTGTVSFYLNGSDAPIATVTLADDATASFTTAGLGSGSNSVIAVYDGDASFTGSTSDTVTVTVGESGGFCTVTGRYDGTLIVRPGQTVTICDAVVTGSILVRRGGIVDVENSQIHGAITAVGTGAVRICGSATDNAVLVSNSRDFVLIGDPADGCVPNTIGGSLIVRGNHHGVQVIDNTVSGAVVASGNSGSGPFPNDTAVRVTGNHH